MRVLAAILLLMCALRLHAVVAVVNDQESGELTPERVRDMLLGRVTTWPSGQAVTIVLCTEEADEPALAAISGRSVTMLQRGWKRLVFSGTGAMPLLARSRSAGLEEVARHPGALMVVMESPATPHCRIVVLTPANDTAPQ